MIYDEYLKLNNSINNKIINELKKQTTSGKAITNFVNGELSEIDLIKEIDNFTNGTITQYNEHCKQMGIKVYNFTAKDIFYSKFKKSLEKEVLAVHKVLGKNAQKEFLRLRNVTNKMVAKDGITIDTAIRKIVKEGNFRGAYVTYENGTNINFNSYLRMLFNTEQKELARFRSVELGEELKTDVFQVSSHANARPDCLVLENKYVSTGGTTSIVDSKGNKVKVIPLAQTTYLQAGGFMGINCKHIMIPITPGFIKRKTTPFVLKEA